MTSRIDELAIDSNAVFSDDKVYRYSLRRDFAKGATYTSGTMERKTVIFIMLNPSTADESKGDPTVRRCMQFAVDWNYERLIVLNIFALRSTDPKELYTHPDPIGPFNDSLILFNVKYNYLMEEPPRVICAWGSHGKLFSRGNEVLNMLRQNGIQPEYLKLNADGQPAHPLYLRRDIDPTAFS